MNIYFKICTKCKISKPFAEYHKDKTKKDGFLPSCKMCRASAVKEHRKNNKELLSQQRKKRYENNKEAAKKYNHDNKEKIKITKKKRYDENKEQIIKKNAAYKTKKIKTDQLFKLSCSIRSLIGNSMRRGGFTKSTKTHEILGCSFDEFKIHIESQFVEGMSWDNYGEWHYDHITPVSWGKTEEEIIALNNYTNFQPLWEEDNLRKGNKYNG